MKLTRTIAIAVIAGAATWGIQGFSVHAKTLREAEIPAEFPPASYKGKQYVDSRGCVYIRAGINGVTNWVPRVTRQREALCGYQPTFAKAGTAPAATAPAPTAPAKVPVIAPAPKPAAAPAPTPAPAAKPAEPAKIAPKPAPRKVVQAAPKPKPAPAPKPRGVVAAAAKPVAVAVKPVVAPAIPAGVKTGPKPTQVTNCANVTGVSRYYAGVSTPDLPVRCGPQGEPYVTVSRETVTVMRAGKPVRVRKRVIVPATQVQAPAADQVRLVPRHVWEQQQTAKLNAPIPEGYRPVWKDDRLNPKRAHQTADGIAATDLRWTRTVPRQLFKRSTGEVVTQLYPGLIYPYYSYGEMQAAGYTIPDTGVLKQPTRRTVRLARKKRVALVSTKSVAAAPVKVKRKVQAKVQASGKGRYVQIGTFGVESNARNTAARLGALGLPARLGTLTRGGKSYRIVLAGPFAPDQVGAALSKARRAGFHDAFVR